MSFVESLKKTTEENKTPAPAPGVVVAPIGTAPVSVEEADRMRQEEAAMEERRMVAQMRLEQLSASIFARLVSSPDLINMVCTISPEKGVELNQQLLCTYFDVCNHIAAHGAQSHATKVWNLSCGLTQPTQ